MVRGQRGAIALCLCAAALIGATCHRKAPARVFVTNEDSGDVTIIDSERDEVVATVHVGARPRGVRVSPDGHSLYVAITGSAKGGPAMRPRADDRPRDPRADGIAVIDLQRQKVVRVLPSGPDPEAFDISADEKTLFVSNEDDGEVARIDIGAGALVQSISVGAEPEGVAIRPDGKVVYVASEASNEVDVIQTSNGALVARIPTTGRPRTIVFGQDGRRALVTAELGGVVHVIDADAHALVGAPIRTGDATVKPMGIALSSDGSRAFVTNGREGSVAVVDVAAQHVERTIEHVGARPWGIVITPDSKKLYVAAGPDVAVVDVATSTVVKRIGVGKGPWGVAIGSTP